MEKERFVGQNTMIIYKTLKECFDTGNLAVTKMTADKKNDGIVQVQFHSLQCSNNQHL